ncbi:putative phage protein (D protein) [Escherichia coli]|nr:putative phage protein (D protein) [Escherichia coli]
MSKQVTLMTDAIPYQEFAKLIGKSTGAVRRMIDKGKLPVIDMTDPQSASGRAGEYWVAEFSISLATGRADIYTETPVKVSGFKRVIDEQDWTITKVTHFLNNSGFTTSLELEVRLSDVEYETEDDE